MADARSSAWCGCWLRHQHCRSRAQSRDQLGEAREPATPDTANVAVWRHRIGRVLDHPNGMILLQSGNDGGAVRTRWRSVRGVVAWRRV